MAFIWLLYEAVTQSSRQWTVVAERYKGLRAGELLPLRKPVLEGRLSGSKEQWKAKVVHIYASL